MIKKINYAFLKTLCFVQLKLPEGEKNTEIDRFHGNGPYCKNDLERAHQSAPLSLTIACHIIISNNYLIIINIMFIKYYLEL